MNDLIHEFIFSSARRTPAAEALVHGQRRLDYASLAALVSQAAGAFLAAGLERGERVAVYLEKSVENVASMFGASAAGGVFVPVNPLLKPEQVAYILADCNVRVLVTSAWRRDAAPRHRYRHGRDPVHVRQHRQAEGRRAVAP
jgi:acyl-CoA synthetase (AMP-forming)/AMP-acid ligase II